MDVSSLYTNIPNDQGIEAVKSTLTKHKMPAILINVIITFLTLILTFNNFIFNGIHYLQIKGCAMGTKCAPCYANIFMGAFEEKYVYPRIKGKSILYLRYIDDIFLIWTSTTQQLNDFKDEINKVHNSIKFTFVESDTQVNFLDTTVYIKESKLHTVTFKKPTDRTNYLHNTSYHPNNLKKNIPYGQALRLKRICSTKEHYNNAIKELKTSFVNRGYQKHHLDEQFQRASLLPKEQLLQ